jgi:hypothetical protein
MIDCLLKPGGHHKCRLRFPSERQRLAILCPRNPLLLKILLFFQMHDSISARMSI